VVHEGEFLNPNLVVRRARDDLDDFKRPNAIESDGLIQRDETLPFRWKAPFVGMQKVNWDVAVDTTTDRLGMGFIVRDHEGFVLAARSRTKLRNLELVAVEALTAFYATEFSRDLNLRNIFLKGDALQVVNAVKSQGRNWSMYGHIIDDIREVLNCMQYWQIGHVSRVVNFVAHSLAKAGVKQVINQVWMEEISNCICDLVLLEQLALSL
jgi:hypothetical protein